MRILLACALCLPLLAQQVDYVSNVKRVPLLDVRAKGAKLNGVSSDTSAIQSAIAALGTEGKLLYFPVGTYNYSGSLSFTGKSNFISIGSHLPIDSGYTGSGHIIGHGGNIVSRFWIDTDSATTGSDRTFSLMSTVHAKVTGGDIVGIYGAAEATSGFTTNVFGGNFLAQANSGAGDASIIGMEVNTNNNKRDVANEADALNVVGVQAINGGAYNAKWAYVVANSGAGTGWIGGVKFVANSVTDYGIDLSDLSTLVYPIRFANSAGLRWKNSAASAFYDVLSSDSNDDTIINRSVVTEGQAMGAAVALGAGRSFSIINSSAAPLLSVDSTGKVAQSGVAFASLGTPANGTFVWCTNCSVATPCSGGGSGAFAFRSGGQWACPF